MRHIFNFALIALFMVSFAACNSGPTPVEFNNKLANMTDTIMKQGEKWGGQLATAIATNDYSALKPTREDITKYLEKCIAEVKEMKNVKNSQPLKDAMVSYLEVEKQLMDELFKQFEGFNADTPPEAIEAAMEKMKNDTREPMALQKVRAAQTAYGKENNFTIQ